MAAVVPCAMHRPHLSMHRLISPDHPSTAQNVISVGAYDSQTNRTAAFSGRGYTWAFDSIKPDIIAPGVDIISCSNTGGYTSKTGTSMAAPFVTGAAALLMEGNCARK